MNYNEVLPVKHKNSKKGLHDLNFFLYVVRHKRDWKIRAPSITLTMFNL